ncbi:MAG: hypothetical protein ACU0CI_14010 [Shimia sp.]
MDVAARSKRPSHTERIAGEVFRITSRHPVPPTALAALNDFGLAPLGMASVAKDEVSPYCLTPDAAALVWVDVPVAALLDGAPFPYARQRAQATRVIVAPAASERAQSPTRFLGSIGRCGSTLAGAILGAAGAKVVGELDVFSDIGARARRAPGDLALRRRLQRFAGEALSAVPADCIAKLRSQAAPGFEALMAASSRPAVFLVRDFDAWHSSMHRAFPAESDDALLTGLADGLKAVAACGDAVVLHHYETLRTDPGGFARAVLGARARPVAPEVLARDSQAGTALDRTRIAPIDVDHQAARARWRDLAPRAALERLGLRLDLTPA